jgi:hypothetical protein
MPSAEPLKRPRLPRPKPGQFRDSQAMVPEEVDPQRPARWAVAWGVVRQRVV